MLKQQSPFSNVQQPCITQQKQRGGQRIWQTLPALLLTLLLVPLFTATNTRTAHAQVVTTLAGNGTAAFLDGTGTGARFNSPVSVCSDGAGNVFVADQLNNRIRQIVIATGVVTTLAGDGTAAFLDGTGTAARLNGPVGVCSDGAGNLFVADRSNHRIRRIVIATGVVTTLAGNGIGGFLDGTGTGAQFFNPSGVCSDGAGNLFVADRNNNRIRRIVISTGVVTTLAGDGTAAFLDGTGTGARFDQPTGVCSDGAGNLFIADFNNSCIRRIVISTGVVTTLAGNGTAAFLDGTGTGAQFNNPRGICSDGAGNLFVADQNNQRIRRIAPQPTATYSGTVFTEDAANNGSITVTQDVTLTNDTWVPAGAFTGGGTHFTATGVPAGLTIAINRISATVARISFTGNAAAHAAANNTTFTLTFANAALTGNNATAVTGLNLGAGGLSITYTVVLTIFSSPQASCERSL